MPGLSTCDFNADNSFVASDRERRGIDPPVGSISSPPNQAKVSQPFQSTNSAPKLVESFLECNLSMENKSGTMLLSNEIVRMQKREKAFSLTVGKVLESSEQNVNPPNPTETIAALPPAPPPVIRAVVVDQPEIQPIHMSAKPDGVLEESNEEIQMPNIVMKLPLTTSKKPQNCTQMQNMVQATDELIVIDGCSPLRKLPPPNITISTEQDDGKQMTAASIAIPGSSEKRKTILVQKDFQSNKKQKNIQKENPDEKDNLVSQTTFPFFSPLK